MEDKNLVKQKFNFDNYEHRKMIYDVFNKHVPWLEHDFSKMVLFRELEAYAHHEKTDFMHGLKYLKALKDDLDEIGKLGIL